MGTVYKIALSLDNNTGYVVAEPDEVTLDKGDQIVFVASDENVYTVIIEKYSIYFNSTRTVFIRDVDVDRSQITVDTKANTPTPSNDLYYTVIVSTADNAYKNDPDAPPRIIVLNHQ